MELVVSTWLRPKCNAEDSIGAGCMRACVCARARVCVIRVIL